MAHDAVTRNLDSMDGLDFTGWNGADSIAEEYIWM